MAPQRRLRPFDRRASPAEPSGPRRGRLARAGAAPIEALSVGQFQRLLFARLIVEDAPIILLDEPFNAIDQRTTEDLLRLVTGWAAEGRTVVAAIHDLDMARRAFPEALLIAREPIAWGATRDVLDNANLARARALAEGWLEHAPVCEVPA